jgi:DNA-binding GntR family transcriptional regulator
VREALLQLKLEGLVDIQPQRGSFVFSLAPEEAAEMCQYPRHPRSGCPA